MGIHALVLGGLLPGCSNGDLGAVSVRWRIVDLMTSVGFDPKAQAQSDGSCAGPLAPVPDGTAPTPEWVVHHVRLKVTEPVTNVPIDINPDVVVFSCAQREATTSFQIPLGRFALDLCPFDVDPNVCDEGVTPAPEIRTVKQAEIINLDVIEIGVRPPMSAAPQDAGADAAADGGVNPP
jgi:hypothetical protein